MSEKVQSQREKKYMTNGARMLSAIKDVERRGVTYAQTNECLVKSGLVKKDGTVAGKYKCIITLKYVGNDDSQNDGKK